MKKDIDVVFINPYYNFPITNVWHWVGGISPNIGIICLAAYLRENSCNVKIIDANADNLRNEEVVRLIKENEPRFIAISANTTTFPSGLSIAKDIKSAGICSKIVLGGVHSTIYGKDLLKEESIDYVVSGEGEYPFLNLVNGVDLKNIGGLSYRDNNEFKENGITDFVKDLDSLPFPAYDLLPMKKYYPTYGIYKRLPAMQVISSRGCPGKCTFCFTGTHGGTIRFYSSEYLIGIISWLVKDYGIREIIFNDENLTTKRKGITEFCEKLLRQKYSISWTCMSRVDTVDLELLKLMKKSGCHSIGYGVESADNEILKLMRKNITIEKSKEAIEMTLKAGIQPRAYFIVGSLGETNESCQKTYDFVMSQKRTLVGISIATPYPGTELYRWANENDCLTKEDCTKMETTDPSLKLPTITPEEVKGWFDKIYRTTYYRPWMAYKMIRSVHCLKDVQRLLMAAICQIFFRK